MILYIRMYHNKQQNNPAIWIITLTNVPFKHVISYAIYGLESLAAAQWYSVYFITYLEKKKRKHGT